MKVYDEEKGIFGVLTFDDLGVTQDQGQKSFIITWKYLNTLVLYIK